MPVEWHLPIEPVRQKFQNTSLDEDNGTSTSMSWPNHAPKHIISDIVYGAIKVPSPIDKIIDTREFQRLRNLKQLGLVNRVYPNCEHSRFTHSLGVFSLAHNLVDKLKHNQPSLSITAAEHCCVSIAALLHDVGHGPFSHLFDGEFAEKCGRSFKHEEMSVRIIRRIMEKEDIRSAFESILGSGDEYDKNVKFITELIIIKPFEFKDINNFDSITDEEKEETVAREWKNLVSGRGPEKSFLYDIVANNDNGHDVDKMDYLLRDSKASGFGIGFSDTSLTRLFDHVRVVIDPNTGLRRVGYSMKCLSEIKAIGDSRQALHSKVYQHRAVRFIEKLMVDALFEAGGILKYEGSNGRMVSFAEVTEDVEAYLKTSDFVEQEILNSTSTDPKMIDAKALLVKIQRREIGSKLGYFEMSPTNATQGNGIVNNEMGVSEVEKKVDLRMREILKGIDDSKGLGGRLTSVDFRVMHSVLGRGLDEKTHPIEKQIFYDGKPNDNEGVPMMGCYVDEDYILNNCTRMATKWEIFVMGDRSLKEDRNSDLKEYIKQALRLAGETEKFLTPRKRSPPKDETPDPNCGSAAKRRLFSNAL